VIHIQLVEGVLLALAGLIGAAIVLSLVMLAAGSVTRRGQAPHGGIRRDLPQHPQPEPDTDEARVLVLR
jgi:hypothetical protein